MKCIPALIGKKYHSMDNHGGCIVIAILDEVDDYVTMPLDKHGLICYSEENKNGTRLIKHPDRIDAFKFIYRYKVDEEWIVNPSHKNK